jgi:hypothetical protein
MPVKDEIERLARERALQTAGVVAFNPLTEMKPGQDPIPEQVPDLPG